MVARISSVNRPLDFHFQVGIFKPRSFRKRSEGGRVATGDSAEEQPPIPLLDSALFGSDALEDGIHRGVAMRAYLSTLLRARSRNSQCDFDSQAWCLDDHARVCDERCAEASLFRLPKTKRIFLKPNWLAACWCTLPHLIEETAPLRCPGGVLPDYH